MTRSVKMVMNPQGVNEMPRIDETTAELGRRLARETERVAKDGLQRAKARARRQDRVGNATYRALELVHSGLGTAARTFGRLEEAVQPPARGGRRSAPKAVPPREAE
jgi:hypothetical protein